MTDTTTSSQTDATNQERKMTVVNPHTPLHTDELRTSPLVEQPVEDLKRMLVWPNPFLPVEANSNDGDTLWERKLIESPFGVGRFASPGLGLIGEFPSARAQTPHTAEVDVDKQWEIIRNPFGDGTNLFLGAVLHVLRAETSGGIVRYAYALTLADVLTAVNFAEKQAERHLGEMVTGLPAEMRKGFLESVRTVVRRKRHLAGRQEAAIEVTRQQYAEYLDRSEAALVSAQKATKVACSAVYAVNKVAASLDSGPVVPERQIPEPISSRGVTSGIIFRGKNKNGESHAFSVPRRAEGDAQFPYLLISRHGDKYPHFDWVGWGSVLDRVRVEFGSLDNVEKVEAL